MSTSAERDSGEARKEPGSEETALSRAGSAWVNQLARTLKTCRLYDASNPTVVKFREDLASSLRSVVDAHGSLCLRFTSSEVMCGQDTLYAARSREDNLAAPFFRDGIRSLTFAPGIESAEVETLLDHVLRVTSRSASEEDLVTLLWDSQLTHVDMSYVSTEAEVDSGDETPAGAAASAAPAPWPKAPAAAPQAPAPGTSVVATTAEGATENEVRSDDWTAGVETGVIDSALREIESASQREIERFGREYTEELAVPNVTASIDLIAASLESGTTALDRAELARFVPRLLRETLALGRWTDGQRALDLLRHCESDSWDPAAFAAELAEPGSVTTAAAIRLLDQQGAAEVQQFLALGRDYGPDAVDWLMPVLAASRQQRVRRPLTKVIAELCRENPERIAPWLSDERWYVVRNIVHIYGWIGGAGIVSLLKAASKHEDLRVRQEVVAALSQAGAPASRPLLLDMLEGADTRIFCAALHQLSGERNREIARLLLGYMLAPAFAERPPEERRAIYLALAAVGDDDVVTELESELHRTKWFSQAHEQHRQSVARCIARIGTPRAREALERAMQSKSAPVRKAVRDVLAGGGPHE